MYGKRRATHTKPLVSRDYRGGTVAWNMAPDVTGSQAWLRMGRPRRASPSTRLASRGSAARTATRLTSFRSSPQSISLSVIPAVNLSRFRSRFSGGETPGRSGSRIDADNVTYQATSPTRLRGPWAPLPRIGRSTSKWMEGVTGRNRRYVTRMSNSSRFEVSASRMCPASHQTKCRPKP